MDSVIQIDVKTVLMMVSLLIPILVAIYKLFNKVETQEIRISNNESHIKELKSDKTTIQESINALRLDIQQGFTDIKLQLKDKADRDDKKK